MAEQRLSLVRIADLIDDLLALIGDEPELFGRSKREARELLKRIKGDFAVALKLVRNDRADLRTVRRLLDISAQTVPGAGWIDALTATRDALRAAESGRRVRA